MDTETIKYMLYGILAIVLYYIYKAIKKDTSKFLRKLQLFIMPSQLMENSNTFTREQIKALSDRRTISKLLFYRTYKEENGMGFYKMADGRIACMFEVNPPAYLSENIENIVLNALSLLVNDGTVCHITAFAGRNIQDIVDGYEKMHTANNINIKNPELLKDFVKNRISYYKRYRHESMMGKDADFRLRNFTHVISVLFPYDTDDYTMHKQYNQMFGILKDLGARNLPASEFIPLAKEILNPELEEYSISNDVTTKINKQIARRTKITLSDEDGTLILGENKTWMAKVLTTDKFPHEVNLNEYQNAFFDNMGNDYQLHLPCPFLLSLVVKFVDVEKRKKAALSKAKWNIGQLSGLGLTIEKKMPEIKIRREESQDVIYNIDQLGESIVEGAWTLVVYGNNTQELDVNIGAIKKSFDQIPGRWFLKEETFPQIAYQSFLMCLPAMYSEIIHANIDRMDINFQSNNAQIAPLISDFKGFGKPSHIYVGRTGQIMPVGFFDSKTNYNIVVIGPMGSGKSVWANDFLVNIVTGNGDIRLIDFGRSYERFCKRVGGQFIEFEKDNDRCLNFFTHLNTKKVTLQNGSTKTVIHEDEFETLIPIVGLMLGVKLKNVYKDESASSSDKLQLGIIARFIIKALERAFEITGHDAGMKEVRESIVDFKQTMLDKNRENQGSGGSEEIVTLLDKMAIGLENYSIPNAPYFKYFNGVNNINFSSSYMITELDDISDSPILPVVVMSIMQRMAQEAFIDYLKDKNKQRVIGVDEAWKVLDSELFVSFLEDFARRIRKYNGVTLLMTQLITDFFKNSSAEAIFETAAWKIFLPQETESIEKAVNTGKLALNRFQTRLMSSCKSKTPHYNETMIKHGDSVFIALLKLTIDDYWLFTTKPSDRALIDDIMKTKHLSLSDALWYLARTSEGLKESEIMYRLSLRSDDTKVQVDWDKFFKEILTDDKILISSQRLYELADDKNSIIASQEVFMKVEFDKKVYSRGYFDNAAREKGYYFELSKRFFTKITTLLQNNAISTTLSININMYEILNDDFISFVLLLLKDLGQYKSKLLLEIQLDYETKENFAKLISFAESLKQLDINICFDHVSLAQLDFGSLFSINPKMIKIDINEIKTMEESNLSLKTLIPTLKTNFNIQTVFTRIEDEDDIQIARNYGVDVVQGYYLDKPSLLE